MINPKKAKQIISKKIRESSKEDFIKDIGEVYEEESSMQQVELHDRIDTDTQLFLFRPSDTPLHLNAYLACALTGLDDSQRNLVFQLSDSISEICQKHGISLYEPRKHTDPVHNPDVNDVDVFRTDRERVLGSDLLIFLSHYPSTGAGQELDFAYNALLPIIIISKNDKRVSRMVTGIPSFKVHLQYSEPEDLNERFDNCLDAIKPIIEERKMAYSDFNTNIIGQRIRTLREQLGLSRSDIASNVRQVSEDVLKKMEESADNISNPSLIQLRQIAVILKTTVAELIEPDMGSRVVSFLNEWLEGRQAARYSTITNEDRKKLMRRVLLRVVDSLEK